jgi:hypothetical protein
MSIKLLPASVSPVNSSPTSTVSTHLAPLAQRTITNQAGQSSLVPSSDTFSWSRSTSQDAANWIDGTFVEDSESDATASVGEYVSALAGSPLVATTAIALYLFYAAASPVWNGQLINLYA